MDPRFIDIAPTPLALFQASIPVLEQLVAFEIIASFQWDPYSKSQPARLDTFSVAMRLEMPAKRNSDGVCNVVDLTDVSDAAWDVARGIGRLLTLHGVVKTCTIQKDWMHITCYDPIESDSTIDDSTNEKLLHEMQAPQKTAPDHEQNKLELQQSKRHQASRRTHDWVQSQVTSNAVPWRTVDPKNIRKFPDANSETAVRDGELPMPNHVYGTESQQPNHHENDTTSGPDTQQQAQQALKRVAHGRRGSQEVHRPGTIDPSLEVS